MSSYYAEEIYDLEKEIVQLKQKLNKAKECLRFYANKEHWNPNYTDAFSYKNGWEIAQDCLKEIEK